MSTHELQLMIVQLQTAISAACVVNRDAFPKQDAANLHELHRTAVGSLSSLVEILESIVSNAPEASRDPHDARMFELKQTAIHLKAAIVSASKVNQEDFPISEKVSLKKDMSTAIESLRSVWNSVQGNIEIEKKSAGSVDGQEIDPKQD